MSFDEEHDRKQELVRIRLFGKSFKDLTSLERIKVLTTMLGEIDW